MQPYYTPFPILSQSVVQCPVLTVASWPTYTFLRRQVRLSGIPIFKNAPQFVVIYTVKGFSLSQWSWCFYEFPHFLHDPAYVGNLICESSAFYKPNLYIWNFSTYCWSLAWRILSITLLSCEMSATLQWFEHSLA